MANSVPRFEEENVDSFFFSFERIARNLEWDRKYWSMVVQQKLTGKAHAVVSALSDEDADDYEADKEAVLLAYESVPEAYRQKFRGYRRSSGQSYVEFQREKEILVDRWVRSLKVDLTYESLRELVLMEEFKKATPPELRTNLDDHKVGEVKSAAVMADQFELTHKGNTKSPPGKRKFEPPKNAIAPKWHGGHSDRVDKPKSDSQKDRPKSPRFQHREVTCFFCGEKGHVKSQCWRLKELNESREKQKQRVTHGFVRSDASDTQCDSDIEPEKIEPKENPQRKATNGFVRSGSIDAQRRSNVEIKKKCPKMMSTRALEIVDEKYKEFISHGTVDVADSRVSVVILRDTGATHSLMIGDVKVHAIRI